jgi:hypothetical protein
MNYGGPLCKNDSAACLLLDGTERLRRSLEQCKLSCDLARSLDGIPTSQRKVTMILDLAADVDSQ